MLRFATELVIRYCTH